MSYHGSRLVCVSEHVREMFAIVNVVFCEPVRQSSGIVTSLHDDSPINIDFLQT